MSHRYLIPLILAPLFAVAGSIATLPEAREQDRTSTPFSGIEGFSRGLVSVTFDDGWVSQYTNALPILTELNIPATNYITTGCVDVDPACMTQAQIQGLVDRDDEIGSHTVTHPHLTKIAESDRNAELANSKASLRQMFGSAAATNFAAPYGDYDHFTVAASRRYYDSQRTTESGFNTKSGFNRYKLVGQNVLAHTPSEMVRSWIESAKANRYWLILVYHEIGENRLGEVFHIDAASFRDQMRSIKDTGLATVTVRQGLDEVSRQIRSGGS